MTRTLSSNSLPEALIHSRVRHWCWALALIVVFAFVVRAAHLGDTSLRHDEAGRASAAWSASLDEMRWFPPLQYSILWAVRHAFGRSEFAMRLPSAAAGFACVVVLFLFVRKCADTWSGICVAAVAACHPELVALSRIVKEFSIEALMCVVVTWAGFEACRTLSRRRLLGFLLCAILSISLTYTGSLVAASWAMLLGYAALKGRTERLHRLIQVSGVAVVVALVAALAFLWFSGAYNRDGASHQYGVCGGAWPVDYDIAALAKWFVIKSHGMLRYVLGVGGVWAPLDTLIGGFELVLAAASLPPLWRRMRSFCIATLCILAFTVLAGSMKLWPYGCFHTMTFLVPLVCVSLGCGLRHLASKLSVSPAMVMLVVVCVGIPGARAVKSTLFAPPPQEHLRPVFEYTVEHLEPDDAIFIHYETRYAYGFYWQDTGHPVRLQPWESRDNLALFTDRFDAWIAEHPRVWFVFMLRRPAETGPWMEHIKEHYHIRDEYRFNDVATYLIERSEKNPVLAGAPARGMPGE
ncbi:MAG: glycosyltransferase family 39 protein [Phycisphaerae bacterium]|nr:glycosyltransferase family 39 protein [Phycisphaerae bacterium]